MDGDLPLGAAYLEDNRCSFLVWAPFAEQVDLCLSAPHARKTTLAPRQRGYHQAVLEDVAPASRYMFELLADPLDRRGTAPLRRPDPASRFQPEGVHGPSQVVPSGFSWKHTQWRGLPLTDYVIYELHVGTFSPSGRFDGIFPLLERVQRLGVTALELMPVSQFPGDRNWGYDGVFPFAVQNAYGGPQELKALVDACHGHGLAVILDVVYNHLGPEGNYLRDYGPYFTDGYKTPWGEAINFDGPYSDDVRRFFIENALYWVTEYRIDALRIDAVHAIRDYSAHPFLEELARSVHQRAGQLNRSIHVIAESALNDTRVIRSRELGGFDFDAQWNDDFHHSLHALLTGESAGYYADFGRLTHLAQAWREGYVYTGQHSTFRRRRHGNSSRNVRAEKLVVFSQNHDQIGNRACGERLSALVPLSKLKLAAGLTLLSPFLPLLFMGEEYGETAPFPYFISHGDPRLIAAVREGRRREYPEPESSESPPDPQDEATFLSAKLNLDLPLEYPLHKTLLQFYMELIRLRKQIPALRCLSKKALTVNADDMDMTLFILRGHSRCPAALLFHLADEGKAVSLPLSAGSWTKLMDSEEPRWLGSGSDAPLKIMSDGSARLSVPPWSFLLWAFEEPQL